MAVRAHLGLGIGPIERLVQVLEDAGVIVAQGPVVDRFDALSGRIEDCFPVIILNPGRSADRLRFNLAHELGHLLQDCSAVDPKDEEALAHRFAAAFLVPAEAARRELGTRRSQLSEPELQQLKLKYGFSMQAWTRRARDLGIISDRLYKHWQILFRSLGNHVRESVEYLADERPTRLRLLALQALAEGLVDTKWVERFCPEAMEVVSCAESVPGPRQPARLLPSEILRLPPEKRRELLEEAARESAADYATDPGVAEWLEFDDPETADA